MPPLPDTGDRLAPTGGFAARAELVARLREEIRRIERRPGRREGLVPSRVEAVDAVLPGGGFARGALSELAGGPASGKTAVALSLVAGLGAEELFAWIDGRGELYPPAAAARGVDLGRLLVVRPPAVPGGEPPWRAALWACEAVLASGAFAAAVMDIPLPTSLPGADAVARRLQAAAEKGGAVGLWLAGARSALRLPGAVRLELSAGGGRISARRAPRGPGEEARSGEGARGGDMSPELRRPAQRGWGGGGRVA
jgi:protein ImuA